MNFIGEDDRDTALLDAAVTEARRVIEAMGPAIVAVAEARPADVVHAAGTCRMGSPDDADAVTDAYGGVLGYVGLRVAAASVFPRLPKAHPYLACLLLAEHLAGVINAGA